MPAAIASTLRRGGALALALALTAAAGGGLAACGGNDDESTSTTTAPAAQETSGATGGATAPSTATQPTTTEPTPAAGGGKATRLALVAEESGGLRFDTRALSATPGRVTIAMTNPSGNALPHAVELEGGGVEERGATIDPGPGDSTVTATLKPGTYEFYCPVDGHRQAGMEGTLTVR